VSVWWKGLKKKKIRKKRRACSVGSGWEKAKLFSLGMRRWKWRRSFGACDTSQRQKAFPESKNMVRQR